MSMQPSFRPLVEPLEQRDLLTGIQAYVTGGNLYILGTVNTDFIQVTETNNQIAITGLPIAVGNARVNNVPASTVANVIVYGYNGNDYLDLSAVKNNATIYAGDGADTIRCGTGTDTVITGTGFDRVFRPYVANQPVINGTNITDIRQGQNPLCQTDAAMAEAVNEGHNFANDIQYLGNNIYDVNLGGKTPDQKIYFDGWTTPNDPVVTNGEFWTVLLQRARLQSMGINPTAQRTMAQWNDLNTQDHGLLYSVSEALYAYTGDAGTYTTVGAANAQALQTNLSQGAYVVAQSRSASGVSSDGVIGNHAYAVLAVYNDAGTWKIRLYNPWGMDRENGQTMDSLDKSRAAANDGIITLTWQQFTNTANFQGLLIAKK